MLTINKRTFDSLYPDLEGYYDFFSDPIKDNLNVNSFTKTYLKSKLWRLNNLYSIIDSSGKKVNFCLNYSQHKVYSLYRNKKRLIILKSRQQGISTLFLICFFDDALFTPNLNIGLMAQGYDETAKLLERTKFLWDNLKTNLKKLINISILKDNLKEFSFTNNSKIFIRTSFRSTTLQRLHISELGKIASVYPHKADEVQTGTLQALGKDHSAVIESTACGDNVFKDMWDKAVEQKKQGILSNKTFYPVFLSWLDDMNCVSDTIFPIGRIEDSYFSELSKSIEGQISEEQKNFWLAKYNEIGNLVFMEYPGTPADAFQASTEGHYYKYLYVKHIEANNRFMDLSNKKYDYIDVYFDLGIDDYTVCVFVAVSEGNLHILHEYFNSDKAIQHYLEYIIESKYKIRRLYFPHDVTKRNLGISDNRGNSVSTLTIINNFFKDINSNLRGTQLKKSGLIDGIEKVRSIIDKIYLDKSCIYLKKCFLNYSKAYDKNLRVWKNMPRHDKFSHGADVIRQIACNVSLKTLTHKKPRFPFGSPSYRI